VKALEAFIAWASMPPSRPDWVLLVTFMLLALKDRA
jgi:hypothetical protein